MRIPHAIGTSYVRCQFYCVGVSTLFLGSSKLGSMRAGLRVKPDSNKGFYRWFLLRPFQTRREREITGLWFGPRHAKEQGDAKPTASRAGPRPLLDIRGEDRKAAAAAGPEPERSADRRHMRPVSCTSGACENDGEEGSRPAGPFP
jgi:hypothetical protein